jgi:hypothetical protein
MALMNGITAVRYVDALVHSVLQRREDLDGVWVELLVPRDKLLETARRYGPFVTLHARPHGAWVIGDTITLIPIAGVDYLKCHDDGFACDDLGDLTAGALS